MRRTALAGAALRAVQPFRNAPWLWDPIIPASPVLDPDSAAMVAGLSAGGAQHVLGLVDYGVTMAGPAGITTSTPRYDITFTEDTANGGTWGSDPFFIDMPIPDGLILPSGTDGHLVVADPTTNLVYGLWQADGADGATWGGLADFDGDGVDWWPGSSTGCGVSRLAGPVTVADILAGEVRHTMFFSTDSADSTYRYPAYKSDGWNAAGSAHPIPEGARIQLDPSIDLAAIPGITTIELIIGRGLQRHGMICGDNGGARVGILCELAPDAYTNPPGSVYAAAGAGWDYFGCENLPWSSLRVLARWDGR